jgi:hypothetical protein
MGRFAVLRWLMSSLKIVGANLTERYDPAAEHHAQLIGKFAKCHQLVRHAAVRLSRPAPEGCAPRWGIRSDHDAGELVQHLAISRSGY